MPCINAAWAGFSHPPVDVGALRLATEDELHAGGDAHHAAGDRGGDEGHESGSNRKAERWPQARAVAERQRRSAPR